MAEAARTPRARYREQTRAEIKDIALAQLAEGGTAAVALTRIAKQVGLSGPALYRYFDSRDALLTELIRDAYADLAAAVTAVAVTWPAKAPTARARLHGLAGACRSWATEQPHRYLLIQGTPVPGYTAPADTLDSARAVLGPFLTAFEGARASKVAQALVEEMTAWAGRDTSVAEWVQQHAGESTHGEEAGTALAGAVLAWSHLHGAISLEVSGQFAGMGHGGGTLLAAQIDMLADAFGLA